MIPNEENFYSQSVFGLPSSSLKVGRGTCWTVTLDRAAVHGVPRPPKCPVKITNILNPEPDMEDSMNEPKQSCFPLFVTNGKITGTCLR